VIINSTRVKPFFERKIFVHLPFILMIITIKNEYVNINMTKTHKILDKIQKNVYIIYGKLIFTKEGCDMKTGIFLRNKSGFTMIELIFASVVVGSVIIGISNVLGTIYQNSEATQIKAKALGIIQDNLERMRDTGFSKLSLTPDSDITDLVNPDLATLANDTTNNPYPVTITPTDGVNYTVYRIVTNADTDTTTNNLKPEYQSTLPTSNMKMIRVIVLYSSLGKQKRSELTSYISTKSAISLCTSTISGYVHLQGGCRVGWGWGRWWNWRRGVQPTVYVDGYPGLQATTNLAGWWGTGYYQIKNVPCGNQYFLFVAGPGVGKQEYSNNPLGVGDVSQDYPNNNFTVNVYEADLTGVVKIYYGNCVTCTAATNGVTITASDVNGNLLTDPATSGSCPTFCPTPPPCSTPNAQTGFYCLQSISLNKTGPTTVYITYLYNGKSSQVVTQMTPCATYRIGYNAQATPGATIGAPIAPYATPYVMPTVATSSSGMLKGSIYDSQNRTTLITDLVDVYIQGTTGNPMPVHVQTNSGTYTTIQPLPYDTYILTASAPNYILESPQNCIVSSANVTAPALYLTGVGKISGIIVDDVTGLPMSGVAVQVIANNGAGSLVSSAQSDASGTYLAVSVPAASNYKVQASFDSSHNCVYPDTGYYSNVQVITGSTTGGKNFRGTIVSVPISGSVNFNNLPVPGGVMVVAVPSGSTFTPNAFYLTNSVDFYTSQDMRTRMVAPGYGTIINGNGSFSLQVPASSSYDLYAYYSCLSYTSDPKGNTRPPVLRYYQKIPVSTSLTGITQDFTGSWSSY
jgi:Tfp pilus assembly protein PilV